MLQGKVSKWRDVGDRSCGLIKANGKTYHVNASEVQPDETGKRRLIVGEVVAFEPTQDRRTAKGKVHSTARKVTRSANIAPGNMQAVAEQARRRVALLEAQRQKDRAAERQRSLLIQMKSGGYLKSVLYNGSAVVFGADEVELNMRKCTYGWRSGRGEIYGNQEV